MDMTRLWIGIAGAALVLSACVALDKNPDGAAMTVSAAKFKAAETVKLAVSEAVQMFVDAELLETHRPGDFPPDRERRSIAPKPLRRS